jgi:flagellar biosynthesis protein FliQ
MADEQRRPATRDQASVGEVIDYVKTYARQETVGPLRGAGRWIALGAAGAVALGLGLSLLLLGLLRLLQSEVSDIADGRLSWLPYLIVLVVCLILLAVAMLQINKTYLDKEDK